MEAKNLSQGILGLGIRSTHFYIEELNKRYHSIHGDYHTFPCLVRYVDFNQLNPFLPNNFERLIPELKPMLDDFFEMSIYNCLIPNITLHEAYDLSKLDYKIIHPLELTIEALLKQEITSVVLFGSLYTMNSDYIASRLEKHAISVRYPSDIEMQLIDDFRKKIYRGTETEDDFMAYKNIAESYMKLHHVLISCTELSIYSEMLQGSNIIDMAFLQIDKALVINAKYHL